MCPRFLRSKRCATRFLVITFLLAGALPAAATEMWLPGPDMSLGRGYFGLVPLPSGDLLAPGGVIAVPGYTNRVDIFSVAGRSFSETTAMPVSHRFHDQSVLLGNGKVLIAGEQYDGPPFLSHLFTEPTHSWAATVNQPALVRFSAAMVLLPNGKVLYAGGYNGGDGPTYNSADLFDPASSTWSSTGSMTALRWGLSLTLLTTGPNAGKVLVTGGGQRIDLSVEARCELYDPATGSFTLTGPFHHGRAFHTATRLQDGRVLVTGGHDTGFVNNHNSVEIYDPVAGTWSLAASLATPRARHTATLLPTGDVLVVGGAQVGSTASVNASAEIYHPATDAWRTVTMPMSTARVAHAAALLPSGEVLVAGGFDGTSYLASSEIFRSLSHPPTAVAGPGQTVRAGSPVQLDGSASSDDVTPVQNLVFSWSLTSKPAGSAAALSGGATATPSFQTDLPGVYVATLVVTDGDGLTSPADRVTVWSNAAPTGVELASAAVAKLGSVVEFDGTGSADPEHDPLTYQWTLSTAPPGSTATLAPVGVASVLLVPDVPGDYKVTLTVSDFLGAGTPVSVTVRGAVTQIVEVPALSPMDAVLFATLLLLAALYALLRRRSRRPYCSSAEGP